MIVEVDLFSGRPNPRWRVDEVVRREVLAVEAGLEPVAGSEIDLPGLGYRGFVYEDDGVTRRAFAGTLERGGTVFEDSGRVIERLFIAAMPGDLAELRERVTGLLP